MKEARIQHFYDEPTGTLSYVVSDPNNGHAAIVDPVVGYSMVSGRMDTGPSDVVIEYVHKEQLGLEWILETHAHADHLTGAQYIKSRIGGTVAIGE
ncbi:MAG: MBL fold metallo-hydrolase, partial [Woeseiaceae bacterium]|nr:MBL fold metallo-hydrolase [Woeseiaceae bacterium]